MLERLDVPYLDVCAEQLVWRLDAPPQRALATRRVERGSWDLELRLLGASHQVVVTTAAGETCSELVACVPGVAGQLPANVDERRAGLRYRFRSSVASLGGDEVASTAQSLVDRLAGRADALVGAFPGSPHAVTAIEAVDDGWRTWHVYPQAGQVVRTSTVVER